MGRMKGKLREYFAYDVFYVDIFPMTCETSRKDVESLNFQIQWCVCKYIDTYKYYRYGLKNSSNIYLFSMDFFTICKGMHSSNDEFSSNSLNIDFQFIFF